MNPFLRKDKKEKEKEWLSFSNLLSDNIEKKFKEEREPCRPRPRQGLNQGVQIKMNKK